MAVTRNRSRSSLADTLALEPFHKLAGELTSYSPGGARPAEGDPEGPTDVLAFVRGLRLSACLIYIIRERLNGTRLKADWGHILDPQNNVISRECDIIIHRGSIRRWNGSEKPVMDFHFVPNDHAVSVISCKSLLDRIDLVYAESLHGLVNDVCLFAERCRPKDVSGLEKSAREAGYKALWYLYSVEEDGDRIPADKSILQFIKYLDGLRCACQE